MAGPTTVKQLEELLATPNGLRDHLASVMTDVYQDAINPLVRSEVSAAVEKALADQTKAYDIKLENLLRGAGAKRLPMAGAAYNQHAPGASLTGEYKGLGDFLATISRFGRGAGADARLKAFGEADGGTGGFLVPEEFRATLMSLALEEALIRPRATVIPMGAEVVRIPAIRDASHSSDLFGGVAAYWTPETGTLTDSEPTFTQIVLTARKLTGYTIASNELLADNAIALEALISNLFPRAIAWYEEKAFFSGTGAGQPVGLLNADCAISVSKEANQAATTVVAENLDKMFARMLPSSRNRAIWIANPNVFPQLAQMSRSVGTGGAPVWVSNMVGGPPSSIYGRPLFFSEHCETLGTVGDIYFVDPFYYLIGDRQALSMAASPHARFTTDQTVWRFVERLDGKPWLETALTPENGDSLSPIVMLASRA